MNFLRNLLALTFFTIALGASETRANFVFNLANVTLSDGTLATGSFTTNDALTSLVTDNISTANGTIAGFNYTPVTAPVSFSSIPSILVVETADLSHLIQLTFTGGLKATGAPITIGQFDSFEQGAGNVHRTVTGGSVVVSSAVPEPSSILMCSLGLAGLGVLARKRAA